MELLRVLCPSTLCCGASLLNDPVTISGIRIHMFYAHGIPGAVTLYPLKSNLLCYFDL
jgi:hypothetical protein